MWRHVTFWLAKQLFALPTASSASDLSRRRLAGLAFDTSRLLAYNLRRNLFLRATSKRRANCILGIRKTAVAICGRAFLCAINGRGDWAIQQIGPIQLRKTGPLAISVSDLFIGCRRSPRRDALAHGIHTIEWIGETPSDNGGAVPCKQDISQAESQAPVPHVSKVPEADD